MKAKRNKIIALFFVGLTLIFSGVAIYVANLVNKRNNIGPTESMAADPGLPGVMASGWTKVQDVKDGHHLGVVAGKLVGISTIYADKCAGMSSFYSTGDGTSWAKKDIGGVGCLDDVIDWDGYAAIGQYPNSGVIVTDANGNYQPEDKNAPWGTTPHRSYTHPWGSVIWRRSTVISVYDFSKTIGNLGAEKDGVSINNTPAGNKVMFIDRQLGGNSIEADYLSFYPQRNNTVQRLNPRNTDNGNKEWGEGVVVGDNLYLAANIFQGNGRLMKIPYKSRATGTMVKGKEVGATVDGIKNVWSLPSSVLSETPDANIRDVQYASSRNLIYVGGYFRESAGFDPVVYSMDLNGHVTGQVRGFASRGYQVTSTAVYSGKLYATLEGAGKQPGISICDLSNEGAVTACGLMELFDGYKDLQVFNGSLYAMGPNGIYKKTNIVALPDPTAVPTSTPTPTPSSEPTRIPQATATPTNTPTPSPTSTPEPTRAPNATATSTPTPTNTPVPTATLDPQSTATPSPTTDPGDTSVPTDTATPTSSDLPQTGIGENVMLITAGVTLLGLGAIISTRRRRLA